MGVRSRLYLLGRRLVTFPQWESYYREITGGADLSKRYLSSLLEHAAKHVPYYSAAMKSHGRLEDLPVLTKPILQAHFDDLKSDQIDGYKWYLNSSGGSTGQPQTFVQDRTYLQWNLATQAYYYRAILGIEFESVRKVVLWGSERDFFHTASGLKPKLSNWLTQTTFLNTFKVSPSRMREYINIVNRRKPRLIKGYAGSLYELARTARDCGIDVHAPDLVYSSAETLMPHMRETIEETFGCKVFDFYGSREVGAIAGECRSGMMHVFDFNTMVEVVDAAGQPVEPGKEGRLIVTTLHNYSMPLIRYEIGDTGVRGGKCDCGLTSPTLERVTGRLTDHFITTGGDIVHGEYFTHLFYFRDWIKEFQVLQTDVDRIEVYFVSDGEAVAADVDDINDKIRLVMGQNCVIEWIRAGEIPRTPQGKMLYTRSLVWRGETLGESR